MERNAITSRSFAILFIVEFLFSLVFPISHPVAAQLPPVLTRFSCRLKQIQPH